MSENYLDNNSTEGLSNNSNNNGYSSLNNNSDDSKELGPSNAAQNNPDEGIYKLFVVILYL
jgi:hypothetical protein